MKSVAFLDKRDKKYIMGSRIGGFGCWAAVGVWCQAGQRWLAAAIWQRRRQAKGFGLAGVFGPNGLAGYMMEAAGKLGT